MHSINLKQYSSEKVFLQKLRFYVVQTAWRVLILEAIQELTLWSSSTVLWHLYD